MINFQLMINFIKTKTPSFYPVVGSFVITAGWNWYHLAYRPHYRFVLISLAVWAAVWAAYRLFKWLFVYLTGRFKRHPFWQKEFPDFLDELFLIISFTFLIFFSRWELLSLVYFVLVMILFFIRLHAYLRRHPAAAPWLAVNRAVFILGLFIFLISSLGQYLAYHYYILDSNIKFYNIVFFRSFAMTMFWLLGFAVAGLIYWQFKNICRYALLVLWSLFFVFGLFFLAVNIGLLYFSNLYLSPFILTQAEGGGGVIWNRMTYLLLALFIAALLFFLLILKEAVRAHRLAPKRYWYFYNLAVMAAAILSLLGLASFKNTPEYTVARAFFNYFRGETEKIELNLAVKEKLERFGLNYDLNRFNIAHRDKVYQTEKKLLPDKFIKQRPNIVIVFLESFSARLTGPYNSRYQALTPGLNKMTANPGTTVFKKVFNASTPTVTGLIAELCSFLPPTGHDEIEGQKRLQRHRLLCLPDVLKKDGGYKYAAYITAVEKNYANKGTIFASMGVDDVFGTEELAQRISGEPLAWGYSDHQMFPFLGEYMKEKSNQQPFLLMLSTVDSHPPFDIAKDLIKYGDGKNNLLNSFHTTDNAFAKWWDNFVQSEFYDNTIVVAIADHAVFPAAYTADTMPEGIKRMNFYDEIFWAAYIPNSILPKEISLYSSSLDLTPSLLQLLGVNPPNSFEGRSVFDDREKYPNLLGMHEFGFFMNQIYPGSGIRKAEYNMPSNLQCADADFTNVTSTQLTFCEFLNFYRWKRQMLEEGRFWEK